MDPVDPLVEEPLAVVEAAVVIGVCRPECLFELGGTPDPPAEPFDVLDLGGLGLEGVLGVVEEGGRPEFAGGGWR